jgi:hypothetical protein
MQQGGLTYWHFGQDPSQQCNQISYIVMDMFSIHWSATSCDAGVHMAASNMRKERGGRLRYTRGTVIGLRVENMQCES